MCTLSYQAMRSSEKTSIVTCHVTTGGNDGDDHAHSVATSVFASVWS